MSEDIVVMHEEAVELYPHEYILMRVTEGWDDMTKRRGVVVAHHPKRGGIQRKLLKYVTRAKQDGHKYAFFFGFHAMRTKQEWDEAIAREIARIDAGP